MAGGAPYALGTSSPVTTTADSVVVACARAECFAANNTRAADATGTINLRPTPEKKKVFLIEPGHDYKIVINGKTFFGYPSDDGLAKNRNGNGKSSADAISAGLALRVAAQLSEAPWHRSRQPSRPEIAML